jgi:hypothetical protein
MKPTLVKEVGPLKKGHPQEDVLYEYHDKRYDWLTGKLRYEGRHHEHNASTKDKFWIIWKYTWSGNNKIREQGPVIGSWDGRFDLEWGDE